MDWDKCNFKKIHQRTQESKRWQKRCEDAEKKSPAKGQKNQAAKKKKRKRK